MSKEKRIKAIQSMIKGLVQSAQKNESYENINELLNKADLKLKLVENDED